MNLYIDPYGIRMPRSDREPIVRSRKTQIDRMLIDPSYSNPRFGYENGYKPRTIFLDASIPDNNQDDDINSGMVRGLHYEYSDRFAPYFGDDADTAARDEARQAAGNNQSARYFEAYLRAIYKEPQLRLWHLMSGINRHTLYSYLMYGFTMDGNAP